MSDQPSIIRQDHEHSVTVSEGTLVATSKPSDPNAPQVRQNLVGEDKPSENAPSDDQADLPPPLAATAEPAGAVFERTARSAPERVLHAPEDVPAPLTAPSEGTETAVDRFLRERRLAAAEGTPIPEEAADAPVFERTMQDHVLPLPVPESELRAPAQGPVFERSTQDHFETLPVSDRGVQPPAEGPSFKRSLHDHAEPLPSAPGHSGPSLEAPVLERSFSDHRVLVPPAQTRAPREGSSRLPAPEPVPLEQARQEIAQTGQALQQRLEENIGAADAQWVEMDFPARVIKLKIENDKVRVRLDQLEAMASPRAPASASL